MQVIAIVYIFSDALSMTMYQFLASLYLTPRILNVAECHLAKEHLQVQEEQGFPKDLQALS